MNLTWDEPKRQAALADRGIDFADAQQVFARCLYEFEDIRHDYGECRMICIGFLADRLMVVGYVQRGESRPLQKNFIHLILFRNIMALQFDIIIFTEQIEPPFEFSFSFFFSFA